METVNCTFAEEQLGSFRIAKSSKTIRDNNSEIIIKQNLLLIRFQDRKLLTSFPQHGVIMHIFCRYSINMSVIKIKESMKKMCLISGDTVKETRFKYSFWKIKYLYNNRLLA